MQQTRSDSDGDPVLPSLRLARIFPNDVIAFESSEAGDPATLHPLEARAAAGFGAGRRAEFAAGRACARRALAELGITDFALEINPDRSPRWPACVAGSITHTRGFCAAVAAMSDTFVTIGIDAERAGRITAEMHANIYTPDEARWLATLAEDDRPIAATIVFSAKEAYYKFQYPLTKTWRDFHDVHVDVDPAAFPASAPTGGAFTLYRARPAVNDACEPPLPTGGRFVVEGDLIITGIAARRLR